MKKRKKRGKNIFVSLAIALLAFSAGIFPVSAFSDKATLQEDAVSAFSGTFSQTWVQDIAPNFDFIKYLSEKYSEPLDTDVYTFGSSIKKAIENKDYDSYIDSIKSREEFSEGVGVIDKSDFDILVELKKQESINK